MSAVVRWLRLHDGVPDRACLRGCANHDDLRRHNRGDEGNRRQVHGALISIKRLAKRVLTALRAFSLRRFLRNLTIWRALALVVLAFVAVVAWSYSSYVITNDDGGFLQRSAAWARNNHLGAVVDQLEKWKYSDPPSNDPADELGISAETVVTTTTVPPSTTIAPELTVEPENVAPLVTPALENEGVWLPISETSDGKVVVWAMSMRPIPDRSSVVATYVTIDQESLVAGLFNGSELPGGTWVNDSHLRGNQVESVIATFNGGFRFEHMRGGYFTEGKMVEPLQDGEATFAISNEGKVLIGQYGRDMTNDGSWKSLRQNLPLMVDGGKDNVANNPGVYWGSDYNDVIYVLRSAVCQMKSGAIVYAIVGNVDIKLLSQSLLAIGCERAMQLDINGNWPRLITYKNLGSMDREGVLVDNRMETPQRYLLESRKDYFSFFDPVLLQPGAVK